MSWKRFVEHRKLVLAAFGLAGLLGTLAVIHGGPVMRRTLSS